MFVICLFQDSPIPDDPGCGLDFTSFIRAFFAINGDHKLFRFSLESSSRLERPTGAGFSVAFLVVLLFNFGAGVSGRTGLFFAVRREGCFFRA